jgi:hypothetical protein
MTKVIAIHQPNYLPYTGFFDKMNNADIFVIYDDAQFSKEEFQHRNKIRIFQGWKWLTVPVEKKLISTNMIKIKNELSIKGVKWNDVHYRDIKDNYKDTPYFSSYESQLQDIYTNKYNLLLDLNMEIIHFLRNVFNIKTKLIFSSELGFRTKSTERLVEIVEALDGDVYLSGLSGHNYLNTSIFKNMGIEVKFQDFKHPIYKQHYEGFIPNMSVIDALFNVGKLYM